MQAPPPHDDTPLPARRAAKRPRAAHPLRHAATLHPRAAHIAAPHRLAPERQLGFIEALADLGSVRAAANAVGMTPESAYMLRRHEQAGTFRKAWEAALDRGVERLEDAAMDRALHGVEVPVYSYGKLVGTRRVFNDRLLMFILRNRAAQRFAEHGTGRALTPAQQKAAAAAEKRKLARLKAQWRAEWLAELEAGQPTEQELYDSIDAKIRAMQEREAAGLRLLEQVHRDDDADPDAPATRHPAPDPALLPPRPAWMSGPAPALTTGYATPLDRLDPPRQWQSHVDHGRIEPAAGAGEDAPASPDQDE